MSITSLTNSIFPSSGSLFTAPSPVTLSSAWQMSSWPGTPSLTGQVTPPPMGTITPPAALRARLSHGNGSIQWWPWYQLCQIPLQNQTKEMSRTAGPPGSQLHPPLSPFPTKPASVSTWRHFGLSRSPFPGFPNLTTSFPSLLLLAGESWKCDSLRLGENLRKSC